MLSVAQASYFVTMWLTSLAVTTYLILTMKDWPSTPEILSWTHFGSPDVYIATRIGDTGEPCCIPTPSGCLSITSTSITINTIRSVMELVIHCMRSPSSPLPLIEWISLPLPTLLKAALMSNSGVLPMWPSLWAAGTLSTMIATASIANCCVLLPYWLPVRCPLLPTSSISSSVTTFLTTHPMHLSKDMERYTISFV